MNTNYIISLVVGFALGFAVSWYVFSPTKVEESAAEAPAVEVAPVVPADAPAPAAEKSEVVPLPPQETVDSAPAPAEAPKAAN